MLLVFEGAEGVGKSTQLARLADWLRARGRSVMTTREPGGTSIGDEVRRLVLLELASNVTPRAEALLFMASRAQLVDEVIRPALAADTIVLVDRFLLSTYAYQGSARGLPLDEIRPANQLATAGLVPDLTFLLRMGAAEGLKRVSHRGAHDRLERAELAFHESVVRAFDEFAEPAWQQAHAECGPIRVVDASGTPDDVFSRIRGILAERWPSSFNT